MKQEAYFLNNSFVVLRRGMIRLLSLFVATRRGRVIHLLSLPWLVLLAWLTSVAWFLTDDAFISFRYVRNLLEGHGLVFNPGEYVEGYTNFLWILELAALWGLFGLRPEQAAPGSRSPTPLVPSLRCGGGWLGLRHAMTGASSPGWPWGYCAAARPLRCGPPAAGWKPGSSPALSSWRSSAWACIGTIAGACWRPR